MTAISNKERIRLLTQLLAERQRHWSEIPSWWIEDLGLLRNVDGSPSYPDEWQAQILDHPARRKILNIHRQAGKSAVSSLKCLHKAIFKPGSLSLIIAPSLRQSRENFNSILKAIDRLPTRPMFKEFTKLSLETDKGSRIICLPGGNDGETVRGFARPDIIIEDEASRCTDDLHFAIVPMMTSNPGCEFVLCSTPWGQQGHFFKIWTEASPETWLKVELRAEDNPRISKAFLEEQRNGPYGPFYYMQEFECKFVASETQLISHDQILKSLDARVPIIDI